MKTRSLVGVVVGCLCSCYFSYRNNLVRALRNLTALPQYEIGRVGCAASTKLPRYQTLTPIESGA